MIKGSLNYGSRAVVVDDGIKTLLREDIDTQQKGYRRLDVSRTIVTAQGDPIRFVVPVESISREQMYAEVSFSLFVEHMANKGVEVDIKFCERLQEYMMFASVYFDGFFRRVLEAYTRGEIEFLKAYPQDKVTRLGTYDVVLQRMYNVYNIGDSFEEEDILNAWKYNVVMFAKSPCVKRFVHQLMLRIKRATATQEEPESLAFLEKMYGLYMERTMSPDVLKTAPFIIHIDRKDFDRTYTDEQLVSNTVTARIVTGETVEVSLWDACVVNAARCINGVYRVTTNIRRIKLGQIIESEVPNFYMEVVRPFYIRLPEEKGIPPFNSKVVKKWQMDTGIQAASFTK